METDLNHPNYCLTWLQMVKFFNDYLISCGGFGRIGNIIVGVVGAFIGGWLAGLLGFSLGGGLVGSIITAVIGAVLLLFLIGLIRK